MPGPLFSSPSLPLSPHPFLFPSLSSSPSRHKYVESIFCISDDKEIYDHNNKIPDFQKLFYRYETESGNQKMQLTAWDQRIYRRCSRLDSLVQLVAPVDR